MEQLAAECGQLLLLNGTGEQEDLESNLVFVNWCRHIGQCLECLLVRTDDVSEANYLLLGMLVEYASLKPEMQVWIMLASSDVQGKAPNNISNTHILYRCILFVGKNEHVGIAWSWVG